MTGMEEELARLAALIEEEYCRSGDMQKCSELTCLSMAKRDELTRLRDEKWCASVGQFGATQSTHPIALEENKQ